MINQSRRNSSAYFRQAREECVHRSYSCSYDTALRPNMTLLRSGGTPVAQSEITDGAVLLLHVYPCAYSLQQSIQPGWYE